MSSENFRARAALAMIPRPKRARVRGARELYDLQQKKSVKRDDRWEVWGVAERGLRPKGHCCKQDLTTSRSVC